MHLIMLWSLAKSLCMSQRRFISWYDQFKTGGATENYKKWIKSLTLHLIKLYIHACIIDHYDPSVRIIDLVSHTTYVAGVNFIYEWRHLQFKVDFERQTLLVNFSWQSYLRSAFLTKICWEEIAEEIPFVFCFDV